MEEKIYINEITFNLNIKQLYNLHEEPSGGFRQ